MKTRKAIYAGSFDPLTKGHLWVIDRAVRLFDQVTVAIGENPSKTYFLPLSERKKIIENVLEGRFSSDEKIKIEVIKTQYLVNYARERQISCLIRGIRSESDFSYEYAMSVINQKIDSEIDSIYLMPPPRLAQVSSSLVKSMVGPEGWEKVIANYVPDQAVKSIGKILSNS